MSDFTRREWIVQSLSLTGAAFITQLPPQFGVPATPPCDPSTKPTPARAPKGFQVGAPWRKLVMTSGQAGVPLTLSGAVIGIRCGFIADAVVDAWVGEARGRQRTDAGGRYEFHTAVPTPVGTLAPRVNLRVEVPKKTILLTYLFLPDEVAGDRNKRDAGFDPLLRMKLVQPPGKGIRASFDVILDL